MTEQLCNSTAIDPDSFFAGFGTEEYAEALSLCAACPSELTCRAFAREEGVPYGIFGGESQAERERYWEGHGGKPGDFISVLHAAASPLLQQRRDFENFDFQHRATQGDAA
jgi:hypothetical protein